MVCFGLINWDLSDVIKKGDYLYCKIKDHPNATKNGYVLMHRAVLENYLGRLLTKDEVVHHKNKDKKDNRIETLEIHTHSTHGSLHANKIFVELVCCKCGCRFIRKNNQRPELKKNKVVYCSRECLWDSLRAGVSA